MHCMRWVLGLVAIFCLSFSIRAMSLDQGVGIPAIAYTDQIDEASMQLPAIAFNDPVNVDIALGQADDPVVADDDDDPKPTPCVQVGYGLEVCTIDLPKSGRRYCYRYSRIKKDGDGDGAIRLPQPPDPDENPQTHLYWFRFINCSQ